jgi:beta-galactosidase
MTIRPFAHASHLPASGVVAPVRTLGEQSPPWNRAERDTDRWQMLSTVTFVRLDIFMRQLTFATTLTFILLLLPSAALATPNEIFPALPAAQDAIHWRDGYFYINGQPTIIRSGSVHYARVPREQWRDRIWRLKMMGFNCVQSYVFWNASEPKEGQWDSSDNVDLDAWLSLLKEMNMYALVRVGPYSCAEWEEGGYPAWLTAKPGMIQREMGPSVPYSDAHLGKVEAIVAKHQINRGGSVIMVQLENEHSRGWGTDVDDPYLKYLDDQARANGIQVPMFNSGLHHSQDPSGEVPFPIGSSPWYSTEFWTGWIGRYGDMDQGVLNEKVRGTWKIIAFGGAGYNYYMAFGGTNFGYSGSGEVPGVSYDYSAPVGEAGQLHNLYFPARRAAYFAQTFTPLLVGSHNDPELARSDQHGLRVTTRTNPDGGSIIFVDHFQQKTAPAPIGAIAPDAAAYHPPKIDPSVILETHISVGDLVLPHEGALKVAVSEPRTLMVNLPWTQNASFESICANILFRQTIGGADVWVCHGPAGDSGEITINRKTRNAGAQQIDFIYPTDDTVKEIDIDSGDGQQAKLLIMRTELTNRTWFANDILYIGPSFVLEDGRMEFPTDGGQATIYTASGTAVVKQRAVTVAALPTLSSWVSRDAAPEQSPDFDISRWLQSKGPQAMETYDSFQNRYGWYRATLHANSTGPVSLHFAGQSGTFIPYMNGQPGAATTLGYSDVGTLQFPDAKVGDNSLAIFVKASPRSKTTYRGPLGKAETRGLWGGVSTDTSATPLDISWKSWGHPPRDAVIADIAKPEYDDSSWGDVKPGDLVLHLDRGDARYRGTFTLNASHVDSMVQVPTFYLPKTAIRPKGYQPAKVLLYLNGQQISERTEDASSILHAGKNSVLILLQSRLGGEIGSLTLSLWHNSSLAHGTWYFHGGLSDLDETQIIGRVTNWDDFLSYAPWQTSADTVTGEPTFWKCTFAFPPAAGVRQSIGLNTTELKAGHVWLNGHNLGESPQKYPLYMPECWLKDGENDLVIFDLYGSKPNGVHLSRYEAFAIERP